MLSNFLVSSSIYILYILLFALGIVLSFVYKERLGRATYISAFGFAVLLMGSVIGCAYMAYLNFVFPRQSFEPGVFAWISMIYTITSFVINVVGYIMIMIALFISRDKKLNN